MFKQICIVILICIFFVGSTFAATPPKNVIILIGDGMGFEQVKAAGMYANGSAGTLSFESLPYQADCTTYAANASVTDSAAAGSAIATGQKTNYGVVSLSPIDGSENLTLLEYFKSKGKSTGLVTTVYISHATPACFGAHETNRGNYASIINDYLTQTKPNVLMGGANYITSSATSAAGYTIVTSLTSLQSIDTNTVTYLSGQFGGGEDNALPYEWDYNWDFSSLDQPHLSDMTEVALDILDNDPDGFFLMIEGGMIDWAGHDNLLGRNVGETIEFSNATQTVLDWASGRTDTLILVTADHECGGLTVTQNNGAGVLPTVTWSTTGHTAANVPVYATGVNADQVSGTMDNTDFFNLCISSPGVGIHPLANNATIYYGEAVTLKGEAYGGTAPYTYSWESDVDGYLGSGQSIVVSDLSVHKVGSTIQPHTITLTLQDADLNTDTAQTEVTVLFKADFQPDGDVDLEDYAIIAKDWGAEATEPAPNAAWWEFNESSGTSASDSTGNGNTGTLYNMDNSDWVTSQSGFGNALDFDGSNDYVRVPNSSSVTVGNGDFSLIAWIYPHSISGDHAILSKVHDGYEKEYLFSVDSGGYLQLDLERSANDGRAKSSSPVITVNEWQKVMVTYNASTSEVLFYRNNQPVALSSSVGGPSNSLGDDLFIGMNGGSYFDKHFDGLIDDVRIYDYIVSKEISEADLDKDGAVELDDLLILVQEWLEIGI